MTWRWIFNARSVIGVILTLIITLGFGTEVRADTLAPFSANTLTPRAYFPLVSMPPACPTTSSASYNTVYFIGNPYKDNTLSDQNADFRLSILGYSPNDAATLDYVNYGGGGWGDDGPRFSGMFTPHRKPAFVKAYRVNQWNWDQGPGSVPPYGTRGAPNNDWGGVTVLDVGVTNGESLNIPERSTPNYDPYRALVLYAGPQELTLAYMLQDQVIVNNTGYVVHVLNLCVDPNLVATYRSQISVSGYRSTMRLPAIGNNQSVGTAMGNTLTIAVRDGARYMDPRGKTNWWYDMP